MSNSDNPRNGVIFQEQVMNWFQNQYGRRFQMEKKLPIGNPAKDHKFDIVDEDNSIVVECKRYTWTETGNVPSAKMGFANEAVFYLSFLPDSYEKYIVMLYSYHQKRQESLAEYYFRTYQHLLGDVIVAEYNPDNQKMRIIGKSEQNNVKGELFAENSKENSMYDENQFFAMPEHCYSRPAQIPIRKGRLHYLEHAYFPKPNDQWVMFHHPNHFMIYDRESRQCIYDAKYACFRPNPDWNNEENPIVAVIFEMTINLDTTPYNGLYPKRGDFGVLADLIEENL